MWTTSAAVCAEGFGWLRKSVVVCVEASSCVRGFEDLKGSAAMCADQNCGFCKELNKHSSVDVAPTLGVNHVISCVVVFVVFLLCSLCIDKYISDK